MSLRKKSPKIEPNSFFAKNNFYPLLWKGVAQKCYFCDFQKTALGKHSLDGRFAQSGTDVMIFLNIFAEKFSEKNGVFDSKQS
jgi:hypothetical protein